MFSKLVQRHSKRLFSRFNSIDAAAAGRRAAQLARQNDATTTTLDTKLAHAGLDASVPNSPMAPPLHLSSTYTRPPEGPYHENDSIYSRMDNPTRRLLEKHVAEVEGNAEFCCSAFASGMMAASAIVLAHQAPMTILLPVDCYHGVSTVMYDVFSRFNVKVERVDYNKSDSLDEKLRNIPDDHDILVWMETPSNPLIHTIDIKAVCDKVVKFKETRSSHNRVTTVVDSTLAPLQQPLLYGADLSMHSATKYLAGHSDALIGVVTARDQDLAERIQKTQIMVGGVASAWDSWLTLRGMRTLSVRIRQQADSATKIVSFLDQHASVVKVHHPSLQQHRHDTNTDSMTGVLSFEMSSEAMAMAVAGALQTIQRATSLGGTETLIEHRSSIEPVGRITSPPGLLRLSVGLENVDDLIADLTTALSISEQVMKEVS